MPMLLMLWVWLCAYLNCAGWTLSAFHELNATGYAVALVVFIAITLFLWKKFQLSLAFGKGSIKQFFRRFSKPLPAIFFGISILIFLGGAIYAPDNYDALTYRLPRILNWLAQNHWFWISTPDDRMNYSTAAWEWIAGPWLALLRSDRCLFLIDFIGFLLMPGLMFSILRNCGVSTRVAWVWMWVFPMAYGFATQAASIGNDLTGAIFALASVFFGLQARRSGKIVDVWCAILAAALMTGTKLSNLPLLLPCLIAVWPALIYLRNHFSASVLVIGIAVMASAAPTIALNETYSRSWTGDPENTSHIQVKDPAAAILGNSLLLAQQSVMPPVLPAAGKATAWADRLMPAPCRQFLREKFPRFYIGFNELPQEETAGLGLGITLLLLVAMISGLYQDKKCVSLSLIGLAAWFAALVYMAKMGSEATARLMLAYYPLMAIPILLLPAQKRLARLRSWNIFAVLCMLSVLPAIVLSPSRPLFPAVQTSHWLLQHYPRNAAAKRFAGVYLAYAHRNDALAPLRAAVSDNAEKIGFIAGGNDTDYSLWRPFGKRQVVPLQKNSDGSLDVPNDVHWIIVKQKMWPNVNGESLEKWSADHHWEIVKSVSIVTLVSWGEEDWSVLRHLKN
ncbi:MAG TPA: hypothetical protein VFV23_11550 [Verrucomicrobiae bacterium]|nr:hypothetical protein [Verrucomicrobiae bacterium]